MRIEAFVRLVLEIPVYHIVFGLYLERVKALSFYASFTALL
jgi:hypothetical protein